ncbi:MAG: signal peptidase I [Pseudomonadales bacterium]|jgi:signal peptidase I|nr:signal peptidase I [Pseudomonadales bacterium]MDP6471946.1 signal peptidase I [Pseudomonadales bacterium]MDP6826784.1 signal peptidase I [Pseudomonadales bacterium]MDP6970938.1 signal peptidase I [Pseudomonadales bacterium]|tara:strand:- start:314 stop:1006 length:693 start_codon:yes stop_codon:yes gene_type:complete
MSNGSTFAKLWRDWRGFLLFVAVMLLFRSAIADWNQVPSGSMLPSILIGDRIVVDKLAYDLRVPFTLHRLARWEAPQRGDVVTFPSPRDELLLVKRIVGIPGDRVELRDNVLIINGERAQYKTLSHDELRTVPAADQRRFRYLQEHILGDTRIVMHHRARHPAYADDFAEVVVPPAHYMMLGDNRDNSSDYRVIGFVNGERILGRAEAIAFSLDYDNYYAPRMDRFFKSL